MKMMIDVNKIRGRVSKNKASFELKLSINNICLIFFAILCLSNYFITIRSKSPGRRRRSRSRSRSKDK